MNTTTGHTRIRLTPAQRAAALAMRATGRKLREIAARFGVSKQAASYLCGGSRKARRKSPTPPQRVRVGAIREASYYVVGVRADGERLILDGLPTRRAAEDRAEVFRQFLEDYGEIAVEGTR